MAPLLRVRCASTRPVICNRAGAERRRVGGAGGGFACLIVLLWLLGLASPAQGAPRVTASFDRDTIVFGESATFTLAFEGGTPNSVPAVPTPAGLNIGYAGQSSQITIIQGQTSSTVSHNYRVTPSQPGEFVIPAVSALVNGQRIASQPARLRVLKPDPRAAQAGLENRAAFVKLIVPKDTVYVGEVFPVEVQLFVQSAQDLQMPKMLGDGFTFGTMAKPTQTRTQLGNTIFNVVIFKVAATPLKTGKLSLGPAECSLVLRIPQAGRRSADPFDLFGDVFGSRMELRPATLRSEAQTIEVLPLPTENQPADFAGIVGDYSIAVSASPTNLVAGDPITLRIQIAGAGALNSLSLPPQEDWRELKVYPPNATVDTTDALGMQGVKTFEQVVIPQNSEVTAIPAFSFSFFDPVQKAYRRADHPPIPLSVRPNTALQAQPTVVAGAATTEGPPPTRDIVHIKPHLGMVTAWRPPLIQQPWFLGLQSLPLLFWISAVLWRKRQEWLAKDPKLRRRRRVSRLVRQGLQQLNQYAQANQDDEFFAAVFRLLQEQLGAHLDLPASAITEAAVDERLRRCGAPEELLASLRDLFALCNQARYAPQRSTQELMSIVPRVEAALRDLTELSQEKKR